jgi:phosphatidate cytidylyltransferase
MSAEKKGQAHLKRWITGLTLLPLLILCVVAGGVVFSLLVGLASTVCLWEYFRIVCPPGTPRIGEPILAAGYVCGGVLVAAAHSARLELIPAVLALNVVLCGLISLFRFRADPAVMDLVAKQIQGVCYIPLFLALLVMIRASADGMRWIFFICALIFVGDTSALYAGSAWGRHKLCPAISPGKTLEGSVASIVSNLLVGAVVKLLFMATLPWGAILLFALGVGLAGQAGDLFESELKRVSKVKDSGGLLPGHGGILDRIDALLFAAPVAFVMKMHML